MGGGDSASSRPSAAPPNFNGHANGAASAGARPHAGLGGVGGHGEASPFAPDDFQLAPPEPMREDDPRAAAAKAPAPDAGCPSSRCIPRDAIDLSTVTPFQAWEAFLDQVREEDELLFAVLADFGLSALEPGRLELAGTKDSFAADQLRGRPDLRATLGDLLAACFGQAVKLDLIDATPSLPELPSLSLVDARRKRMHQQKVDAEARSHPQIRSVLDTFGASLTGVHALQAPPRTPIDAPRDAGSSAFGDDNEQR